MTVVCVFKRFLSGVLDSKVAGIGCESFTMLFDEQGKVRLFRYAVVFRDVEGTKVLVVVNGVVSS